MDGSIIHVQGITKQPRARFIVEPGQGKGLIEPTRNSPRVIAHDAHKCLDSGHRGSLLFCSTNTE